MAEARYTSEAYRDLYDIVTYLARFDPVAATKVVDEIERTCEFIAESPGIGQARPDLRPGIRFLPVGNYLVFYCEVPEGAQIIRVIHGARKYGSEHF